MGLEAPCVAPPNRNPKGLQVGLRSPSTRVWSSRREVALHCVKRLDAASGAGEDEGALERSQQHRRLLVRYRRRSSELDVDAGDGGLPLGERLADVDAQVVVVGGV